MSIETKQFNVTPAMAAEWLDRHWDRVDKGKFKQRPMSLTRVLRYAQSMKDGQWRLTPEGLAFDKDDNLIQGQHRLEAVRRAGVTVPFMISTGWPVETLDVLDQGLGRTNAQLLALRNGYGGYSSRYAGAVTTMSRIAMKGHTAALTFANCEYMLEKLNLKANIDAIMAKSPQYMKDFQSGIVGPLAFYHTARPKKALEFAEGYFNMETTKGTPIHLFLHWIKSGRWLAREPGSGVHSYVRKMSGLSACLRAWDENVTITRVVAMPSALEWLRDMNPKLRDWVKEHIATSANLDRKERKLRQEQVEKDLKK